MKYGVKGQAKVPGSGRQKGTKNKVNNYIHEQCEAIGIDPLKRLIELCGDADKNISLNAIGKILPHMYPSLKSSEVTANISAELAEKVQEIQEMSREEQIQMLEDNLKSLKSNQ